jgi:hypothetical protein
MTENRSTPSHRALGGRASKKLTLVVLFAFVAMVLYMKVGCFDWSLAAAGRVPPWGKYIILLSLLASICYSDWAIQRRVRTPSLPAPRFWLFVWDGLVALAFAVVTADSRILFYSATFAWIFFLCFSSLYYGRTVTRGGKQ